jgi:hypothetical protein
LGSFALNLQDLARGFESCAGNLAAPMHGGSARISLTRSLAGPASAKMNFHTKNQIPVLREWDSQSQKRAHRCL